MINIAGQILIAGVAFGAVYALIAVSFSLIYRSTRTINFAQGHLAMIGGYVAMWGMTDIGVPYVVAGLIGVVGVVALSVIVEVLGFRPLYRFGAVYVIVSSIALTFVLETLMRISWGAQALRLPPIKHGTIAIDGVIANWQQIIIVVALGVSVGLLQILLRSRIGRAMRASAENVEVAGLVGIRARHMTTFSFALAGVLTGIAGILIAPLTYLDPNGGASLGLLGVVAAIVGGLGNIYGAVAGGLIIGLVNVTGAYVVGGNFVEVITFLVLVLVLVWRPQGIFGEEGLVSRA